MRSKAHSANKNVGRKLRQGGFRERWSLRTQMAAGGEFDPLPHWHPNQLRHRHATQVRKQYGLEAAQVSLGHSHAAIIEVYAEKNIALAVRVAAEVG